MRTLDFLLDFQKWGLYKKVRADAMDMEAEGAACQKIALALVDSIGLTWNGTRKRKDAEDDRSSWWDGYHVDVKKQTLLGLMPVSYVELYVLALSLTVVYHSDPTMKESREEATTLLLMEGVDMDVINRVAHLVESVA